jgi:hypothetical protein
MSVQEKEWVITSQDMKNKYQETEEGREEWFFPRNTLNSGPAAKKESRTRMDARILNTDTPPFTR